LSGQEIPEEELHIALTGLNLVKHWPPSDSDRAFYNLPLGWFVDFGNHENFKKVTKVSGWFWSSLSFWP
jgi:hypothetical protein